MNQTISTNNTLVKLVPLDGMRDALKNYTLKVTPEIRKVDGLQHLSVNLDEETGNLYLLYTWETREKEMAYVQSVLCQDILRTLEEFASAKDKLLLPLRNLES